MPGGDRTGPLGLGPRTGRGVGYCAGSDVPGFANPIPGGLLGRGRGMGFGRGRGIGRGLGRGMGWFAPLVAGGLFARHIFAGAPVADEKTVLTEQAKAMEDALANIKRRLGDIQESE